MERARALITRAEASTGEGDWIEWHGGENPVGGEVVDIRFRDGTSGCWAADEPSWRDFWHHNAGGNDIIAYRLASPIKGKG
jgi:hypothetical protein